MTLLSGSATHDSTRPVPTLAGVFKSRRRELWPHGPFVSQLGFGSYRIGFEPYLGYPDCALALESALLRGMNLIDTSTNYGDGQSEQLIGETLEKLQTAGQLSRDQIVLVSKVGYMQGTNFDLALEREQSGRPFPDVMKLNEGVWFCLHPEFIRDQIARSRQRLNVQTLDVYLLHNPEYILKELELQDVPVTQARELFYKQLAASFVCLEELVQEGLISAYGISSNTFGFHIDDPTAVSLRSCLTVFDQIISTHSSFGKGHFRVLQCPLNWLEVAPALSPFDEHNQTFLTLATERKMAVLINRPFNAMVNDALVRLTRPTVSSAEVAKMDSGAQTGFARWKMMSAELEKLGHARIDMPGFEDASLSQLVLSTLVWQPGVCAVLGGFRKVAYLDDAERALALPMLVRGRQILAEIYDNLDFG